MYVLLPWDLTSLPIRYSNNRVYNLYRASYTNKNNSSLYRDILHNNIFLIKRERESRNSYSLFLLLLFPLLEYYHLQFFIFILMQYYFHYIPIGDIIHKSFPYIIFFETIYHPIKISTDGEYFPK